MIRRLTGNLRTLRATFSAGATAMLLAAGCATDGSVESGFYGSAYYEDAWYWGGCCTDPPDAIGPPPPHAENPIARPPPVAPSHPVATPPARPMPAPRPAAMPRGGGGRR
jgi:hypothetical protein